MEIAGLALAFHVVIQIVQLVSAFAYRSNIGVLVYIAHQIDFVGIYG